MSARTLSHITLDGEPPERSITPGLPARGDVVIQKWHEGRLASARHRRAPGYAETGGRISRRRRVGEEGPR